MQWSKLSDLRQLNEIAGESNDKMILIFKHSTRCSISQTVLDRFQRNWKEEEMQSVKPYFLDLISHREISNKLANKYDVRHESPQVLVLQGDKVLYNESHVGIDFAAIRNLVKNQSSPFEQQNRGG